MKAVRIHAFGGPEEVVIDQVPTPKLPPKHALIRVVAAGVNPTDWMSRAHIYNPKGADRVPMTLGQDFSGIIEKIAPGAKTPFKEGDEVFGEVWGAFAEHIVVPLKDLIKKPRTIDFMTAASLPMSGVTAWQVVFDTAHARKGKRFLIHGAGGGVGSLAVQLAKWKGSYVAATGSKASLDYLHRLGVDDVIDYENQRFEDVVRDIEVVVDPFGGDIQRRSFKVMKKGGLLINLIDEVDRSAARKAGVKTVSFGMTYDTEDIAKLARLVGTGMIDPHISKVLPLEQARRAIDMNEHNRSHGKIVLRVED